MHQGGCEAVEAAAAGGIVALSYRVQQPARASHSPLLTKAVEQSSSVSGASHSAEASARGASPALQELPTAHRLTHTSGRAPVPSILSTASRCRRHRLLTRATAQ